ncbi:hypothetical protein GCK32_021266, partial [Trichostrongylus colubriformis]
YLMYYRVCLVLLLAVAYVLPSPLHYDVLPYRTKRHNENSSSTMATFSVERLDAPIERIEIRLIDENSTNTALEPPAAQPPPLQPAAVTGAAENSAANAIDTNTESVDQYDVRYKKVYIARSHFSAVPVSLASFTSLFQKR